MTTLGDRFLSVNRTKISPNDSTFAPFRHKDRYGQEDIEPGHVKRIGFAAGCGHLTYRPSSWQRIPADHAVPLAMTFATLIAFL